MTATWRNWSGGVHGRPASTSRPMTPVELRQVVGNAVREKQPIKAVGAGHSFTPIALTDGLQLDLTGWIGLVAHDPELKQVTVRSGTPLSQLGRILAELGLAMANLGDIDHQTVAGAISTGTHGTGLAYGGLASQVVGLSLLDGTGEEQHVGADDPELLNATRVGLGALGVITEVTLQCVDAFDLHAVDAAADLDEVLAEWPRLIEHHDHFEFYWFGRAQRALTRTNTRLLAGERVRTTGGQWRAAVDNLLLETAALSMLCRLGAAAPRTVPSLNRFAASLWSSRDVVGPSAELFTAERRVRFTEMEYAFDVAQIPAVVAELRAGFEAGRWSATFPIEVRAAAADEAWLSTSYGRATGYVAVHQWAGQDHRAYFDAVEEVFVAHGGRPHWGKLHCRTAAELQQAYPRMTDFLAVRDRLDPDRLFGNAHLSSVLGF